MAKGVKTGISDDVKNAYRLPSVEEFTEAYKGISAGAIKINASFGQTKQRLVEIQTAIADTAPGVKRLGGGINEVTNTINEIAKASRRNVIANSEDVSNMFAAQKILGGSIKDISDSFLNVGVGISQIPKELEKSINYIQSIGGNTDAVMKDVQTNMEKMNRYQFEGGVQGLTKMAAQASMLRFDMKETFTLAEKVLDPEEAIKVASAFQRLGVSAGSLVDPFSLMNQSINDPSGLQDSLVNVSKQFTYFDEKTKTFKINPQGVLTLKEMEKQTGVSAKEMSKMGLAAAELDKRISEVNAAGLHFGSEEDKQYLQNIASMGKGGRYEVELKDGTKKELQQLNQEEFDELIDEQKNGPKTLEEIARGQMTYMEVMANDVTAIRMAVAAGIVTQREFLKGLKDVGEVGTSLTKNAYKELANTGAVRDFTSARLGDMRTLFLDLTGDNKSTKEAFKDYVDNLKGQGVDISKSLQEKAIKILEASRNELDNSNSAQRTANKVYDTLIGGAKVNNIQGNQPGRSLIDGNRTTAIKETVSNSGSLINQSSRLNVDGKADFNININIKQDPQESLTAKHKEEVSKIVLDAITSTIGQQYFVSLNSKDNPTKAPTGKTLARIGATG
jgi:hypothetical protein